MEIVKIDSQHRVRIPKELRHILTSKYIKLTQKGKGILLEAILTEKSKNE